VGVRGKEEERIGGGWREKGRERRLYQPSISSYTSVCRLVIQIYMDLEASILLRAPKHRAWLLT